MCDSLVHWVVDYSAVIRYVVAAYAEVMRWMYFAGTIHLCLWCSAGGAQGGENRDWLFALQIRVWQIVCCGPGEWKVKTSAAVWCELHWSFQLTNSLFSDLQSTWKLLLRLVWNWQKAHHGYFLCSCYVIRFCIEGAGTQWSNFKNAVETQAESTMTWVWIVVTRHHVLQV